MNRPEKRIPATYRLASNDAEIEPGRLIPIAESSGTREIESWGVENMAALPYYDPCLEVEWDVVIITYTDGTTETAALLRP